MAPDRHAEQPAAGVHQLARSGQAGDRLGIRGAEQPDAAVGGRRDPVPLVVVGRQPLPGLRPY